MSANDMSGFESRRAAFRVGLSADFCDEQGRLAFPDIGLAMLDGSPGLSHEFLSSYRAEYSPDQLAEFARLVAVSKAAHA